MQKKKMAFLLAYQIVCFLEREQKDHTQQRERIRHYTAMLLNGEKEVLIFRLHTESAFHAYAIELLEILYHF